MHKKHSRIHIGLRTIKTVAAVVISMIIVDAYGATTSKLIFAMLGAMAAVQPTFKESLESCLTQIVGVFCGGLVGVFLLTLPLNHLVAAGIGIVLVITLYNGFRIRFSPSLPCFIVVMLCTTPDIQPMVYALGRTWDTLIGLSVGMLINTLIFPYDNRQQIRSTMESLDREIILFLEDMFDGDDQLPDADKLSDKLNDIDRQLTIFSKQRFPVHRGQYREELASFRAYEAKARQLVAHMDVLRRMGSPGQLDQENLQRMRRDGASIREQSAPYERTEKNIVTNYHVAQILLLRQELLDAIGT